MLSLTLRVSVALTILALVTIVTFFPKSPQKTPITDSHQMSAMGQKLKGSR